MIAVFLVAGLLVFGFPQFAHGQTRTFLPLALAIGLVAYLLRRLPLSALILILAGLVLLTAGGRDTTAGLALALGSDLAVGWLAANRSAPVSIGGAVLAVLGQAGSLTFLTNASNEFTGSVVLVILAVTTAWMIGNAVRERRRYAEAVRVQAEAAAVTAERLRIAREVHDLVAHSISMIAIQAGVGSRVITTQPAEARKALDAIETASRQTLAELRRTVGALRRVAPATDRDAVDLNGSGPVIVDTGTTDTDTDTDTVGTAPREPAQGLAHVPRLAQSALAAGVRVDVRYHGQPRPMPPDIDLSAYRIIQESVTNVVRHAGTDTCRVTIDFRDDDLLLEIADSGRGGAAGIGSGFGIIGMRERVTLLHGRFSAGPRPDGGFAVSAHLPVPAAAG